MNDKLVACSEELAPMVEQLLGKHDARLVLAALGVRFAGVAAAVIAAGATRQFVLEVMVSVFDCALTPPAKPPIVVYVNDDKVLGRKQ